MRKVKNPFTYGRASIANVKYTNSIIKRVRVCSECGKKFVYLSTNDYSGEYYKNISQKGMCFECAYWESLANADNEHIQVADGVCYRILPYVENPDMFTILGGNGVVRYFVTKDFNTVKSNDVWMIGRVPERFRKYFPDTGWFCHKRIYKRILNFNLKCSEAGCFDRYKCLRFRTEIELRNGPYNKVPDNWKKGDEHCSKFTDTDLVYNFKQELL